MKKFLKTLLIIFLVLLVLGVILIEKIDRTPYQKTAHFQQWKQEVVNHDWTVDSIQEPLLAGWGMVNMTPDESVPMAGYGARWGKHYKTIHDSVYVRAIGLQDQANKKLFFVSADLLIIPPNVKQRLIPLLEKSGIALDNVHFGATHTHTSIGGWGQKLIGSLFAGKYDENVEIHLANKMHEAILLAMKDMKPTQIRYWEKRFENGVKNRLKVEGAELKDDKIRGLHFLRNDSTEALFLTYTAHTTLLRHSDLELTRDFPGFLVDSLETMENVDFSMYMAGAVGSMSSNVKGEGPYMAAKNLADSLYTHTETVYQNLQEEAPLDKAFYSSSITVPFPPSNARISINYALRPWVFASLFGASPAYIKVTHLGDVLILGMPADFSGEIMLELEEYAKQKGLHLIVTSFNGEYMGYITSDKWYEYNLYETTTMSWYGYQAASYITQASKDIMDALSPN